MTFRPLRGHFQLRVKYKISINIIEIVKSGKNVTNAEMR